MKKLLILVVFICFTLISGNTNAQENNTRPDSAKVCPSMTKGNMGHGPQMMNAEQMAKSETDRMQKDLQLSEKQYKKVYRAILEEAKVITGESKSSKSSSGNSGFQGGPQGMNGGMPPMGGQPGGQMQGGRPPMNGQNGQMQMHSGQHNQKDTTKNKMPGFAPKASEQEMKAAREKKMEKLKYILSGYQYNIYETEQTKKEMNQNCPFSKKEDSNK